VIINYDVIENTK